VFSALFLQAASGNISALFFERMKGIKNEKLFGLGISHFMGVLKSPWILGNSCSCSETKKVKF